MKLHRMLILLAALALLGWEAGAAYTAEKIRVGVIGFSGAASRVSAVNADAIGDIFTRELAGSTTIEVYERQQFGKIGEEIKRNASGLFDEDAAIRAGKQIGVRYILLGTVDELYSGDSGAERRATATLSIRVIETETSRVGLALSETASALEPSGPGIGSPGSDLSRIERRAISDAASRLCHAIRASLGQEIPGVVKADGNSVYIDIGSTMGSKAGNLYLVYAEGAAITGRNGTFLGRERFHVAIIKVSQVQEKLSVCVPSGGYPDRIRVGDLVEPVSQAQARETAFSIPPGRGQATVAQQPVYTPPPVSTPPPTPAPAAVVQTQPATPPQSNTKTTTAETASSGNPFLGEWEAVEGRARWTNGQREPLKEGMMKITASGTNNVKIVFSLHFQGYGSQGFFRTGLHAHEIELSELQDKLPKKTRWKEKKQVNNVGSIPSNETFSYTLEFKKNDTVSISVFNTKRTYSAVFKRKK
jgi:hypothetical protein